MSPALTPAQRRLLRALHAEWFSARDHDRCFVPVTPRDTLELGALVLRGYASARLVVELTARRDGGGRPSLLPGPDARYEGIITDAGVERARHLRAPR